MTLRERLTAAARGLLTEGFTSAEPRPTAAPAADVVDNPNLLAQGSRGVLGNLFYSTSALFNAVTGVGTSRDPSFFNTWSVARPLQQSELYGMGRNALIVQALSKLPTTAMREGWRVDITDPDVDAKGEVSDKIAAYEQRLGIGADSARAMAKGRQYGEAMVVLGIDDGRAMSEPVDLANIKSIKWAAVIDVRYYQPAELYQADSEHFTKTEKFRITDINGFLEDGLRYGRNSLSYTSMALDLDGERQRNSSEIVVHADRVMHFPTADYLPLLDTLQDSLGAFFEAMSGIRTAARESTTVVYKISKLLRKMWSENAGLAQQHMAMVDRAKSAMNAWVIDKEDEEVTSTSRSLGGLADLANPFMVWMSAALGIPVTVLWGVSPGGFGKGEAERETWHEEVRAYFQAVAVPQLHKVHGYILAAQDGCQLPADTQREIILNDLSPPDEEVRSKLRSEALNDLRQLVKDDILSRNEVRSAVAALADDYFRPEIDLEAQDEAKTAQVGVFTASIALMQALYPQGVPVEAGRELMLALASTFFTPENVTRIFPERGEAASTATGATLTGAPADIEDDETVPEDAPREPSEVEVAWSENPLPDDAVEASAIAEALKIPTVRVTRAHRAGLIEGWNVLGGKPRYSLEAVRRVVLQGNGKLPAAETPAEVAPAQDHSPHSLCVALVLPTEVARWVPYKAEDDSPPHVTLLYVPDVSPEHVAGCLAELRLALADVEPFDVTHTGEVSYFDTPAGKSARVAWAVTEFAVDGQALVDDLSAGMEAQGYAPSRHGDYVPHTTLAYLQDPAETYVGPIPSGTWRAAQVVAWYGDETHVFDLSDDGFVCDSADERISEAFAKFRETVNMSASELERWAETEWSKKASVSREPIERNLRLLRKPKSEWTRADASAAMRTVSFVARMRGAEQGEPVKIDGREGPSKRDISLKNWAFDPGK